jgi:hypothetical protein
MADVSWGRRSPNVISEIHTTKSDGWRYWVFRALILLAAWIINSKVITRRTLPILEAE